MRDNWIGNEINQGGTYRGTDFDELSVRTGGRIHAERLYTFRNRFKTNYYISDVAVISQIEEFLTVGKHTELRDYLYQLIVERFGINAFLADIEAEIKNKEEKAYEKGKCDIQDGLKQLMGLRHN